MPKRRARVARDMLFGRFSMVFERYMIIKNKVKSQKYRI